MTDTTPLIRTQVTGMSCGGCAARVQRALDAMPGVADVSVNLTGETAQLRLAAGQSAADLVQTLTGAGYPARVSQARLQTENMSCASCVGRAERALMAHPGVVTASVNLATETAHVTYLAGGTDADTLAQVVTDAGYPARSMDGEQTQDASARKADEAEDLRRSFLLAFALALPVFVLEMGSHLIPAIHTAIMQTIGFQTSWMIQFALTTVLLLGPGRRFYTTGYPALLRRAPDMNSLVALGTSAAYGFSVVALFAPALLPAASRAVYFEAAAVIVTLILLGRWLEARAKGRTGAAIAKLVRLAPSTARVERDGVLSDVAVVELRLGDIIHIRPGERLAADGLVASGSSYIDEAMITGEPLPVAKVLGDPVTGGTVNGTGALTVTATAVGADTTLAQIIRLVEDAQGSKLPIQALVDRVTLWFVPAVLAIALVTVLAWVLFGPEPALTHALVAGVAVLIIACPCAMGLATPTSIMVGTGRAAELGVLIRKGVALQALSDVAVVAFDKTGTLTMGKPVLTDFEVIDGQDAGAILADVASLEQASEHPIAEALVKAAQAKGLVMQTPEDVVAVVGHGVRGHVDGRALLVGAARMMVAEGIEVGELGMRADGFADAGKTPVFVARDGKCVASFAVADTVKASSAEAIRALHAMGLRTVMITGDAQGAADAIARQLGIDEVVAEVLPSGKTDALERLKVHGKVAFVGDGINDAPALAAADVGLAIGTGTDIAIEAADVVLMSGDVQGVARAVDISRRTMRNIRQNLFWAFAYNVALIPVAAGVFYPAFGWQLSPILAAGAMALSSVFVLSNALRLKAVRLEASA
ncbi:MAG: Cu+-exporting ATPase [Dinoroseobacter sp.]|jgi:Cu+-exporting ATPase